MGETAEQTYAYDAQTPEGEAVRGTIQAAGHDAAQTTLEQRLGLRVLGLTASASNEPKRSGPMRGEELLAFNQQLAQLTASGLPIERGLRLIARDMKRGRLARSAKAVAAELESGASLPEAFDRHRRAFPPLYAEVVEAGVRTGQLPSVLFNLGRHMELLQRLRGSLWQAGAYPAATLAVMLAVMWFIGAWVAPQFHRVFEEWSTELPWLTVVVLAIASWMPWIVLGIVAVIGALIAAQLACWLTGRAGAMLERVVMPLPLVGTILKRNYSARWCDAVRLGVEAGLDLPESIDLAGRALNHGKLQQDSDAMIDALRRGQSIDEVTGLRALPAGVPAVMAMGRERDALASLLAQLAAMYQEQAELKLQSLQAILTPMLVMIIAVVLGVVITALFLPLTVMMGGVM